jgi:hypothetical protein
MAPYIDSVFNEKCNTLSLNTTFILKQNQLYVLANEDSHLQADHKNIKRKCLHLHWLLDILKLTNVVLYNTPNM